MTTALCCSGCGIVLPDHEPFRYCAACRRAAEDPITTNDYWRHRGEAYQPGWWVDHYWADWQVEPRQFVANAMAQYGPFASVLEVGCHCGPNFRLWRQRWPTVELIGVDLNHEAIAFGRHKFADDPLTVFVEADIFACRTLPAVDLVVGYAMLTTIEPQRIFPLMRSLWATARVGIVFCEAVDIGGRLVGRTSGPTPSWRHDYAGLLAALTPPPGRWALSSLRSTQDAAEGLIIACKETP